MLGHWWLKMVPNYDTKMSRSELRELKDVYHMQNSESGDESDEESKSDSNEDQEGSSDSSDDKRKSSGIGDEDNDELEDELEEGENLLKKMEAGLD